jgi:phage tail tape-measure protein
MTKKLKIIVPVLLLVCVLCTGCGKVVITVITKTPDTMNLAIEPTLENTVATAGGIAGSCAGTAIGIAIGGPPGGTVGGIVGGYAGEEAARATYRMYDSGSKDESEEPAA